METLGYRQNGDVVCEDDGGDQIVLDRAGFDAGDHDDMLYGRRSNEPAKYDETKTVCIWGICISLAIAVMAAVYATCAVIVGLCE